MDNQPPGLIGNGSEDNPVVEKDVIDKHSNGSYKVNVKFLEKNNSKIHSKLPPNFTTFLNASKVNSDNSNNIPGSSNYKRLPFEPPLHIQQKHLKYRFASSDDVKTLNNQPSVKTENTYNTINTPLVSDFKSQNNDDNTIKTLTNNVLQLNLGISTKIKSDSFLKPNASAPSLPHVSEEEQSMSGGNVNNVNLDTKQKINTSNSVFNRKKSTDQQDYLEYQQQLLRVQQLQLLQKQRLQQASHAALQSALSGKTNDSNYSPRKNVERVANSSNTSISNMVNSNKIQHNSNQSSTDLTKQQQLASLYSSRATSNASLSSMNGQTNPQNLDSNVKVKFYTGPKRYDYRRSSMPKGSPTRGEINSIQDDVLDDEEILDQSKRSLSTPVFSKTETSVASPYLHLYNQKVSSHSNKNNTISNIRSNGNESKSLYSSPRLSGPQLRRHDISYTSPTETHISNNNQSSMSSSYGVSVPSNHQIIRKNLSGSGAYSEILPLNRGSSGYLQAIYDTAIDNDQSYSRHVDVDDESILSNSFRSRKNNSQHYLDGYDEDELMFANRSKEEYKLEANDKAIAPGQYLGQDGKVYFDPVKYREEIISKGTNNKILSNKINQSTNNKSGKVQQNEATGFFVGDEDETSDKSHSSGEYDNDDGTSSYYSSDDDYFSSDEWQDSQSEREEKEWIEKKKKLQEERCKRNFAKQPIIPSSVSNSNITSLTESKSEQSLLSQAIKKSSASLSTAFKE